VHDPQSDTRPEGVTHDAFGRSPDVRADVERAESSRGGHPLRAWVAGVVAAAVFGVGGFLVIRASFDRGQGPGTFSRPGGARVGPGFGGGGPSFGGGAGLPGGGGPGGLPPGGPGGARPPGLSTSA
jgi:hypothetical protein